MKKFIFILSILYSNLIFGQFEYVKIPIYLENRCEKTIYYKFYNLNKTYKIESHKILRIELTCNSKQDLEVYDDFGNFIWKRNFVYVSTKQDKLIVINKGDSEKY